MGADPYRYFRIEARELLGGLGQGVLRLEKEGAGHELVAHLLRLAHTLKGAARVVRLPEIGDQAHAIEDLLTPHRDGDGPPAAETIDRLLALLDAAAARVASLDAPAVPAAAAAPPAGEPTVRVEIAEMDDVLHGISEAAAQVAALRRDAGQLESARQLAAELVQLLAGGEDGPRARARLRARADELRDRLERHGHGIGDAIDALDAELTQLRDAAGRLRLVPAATIFPALERAARDAAQALGKRVELATTGGEHRLDGNAIGSLRDALLHIITNAVAHGIEAPGRRAALGKSPAGRIRVDVARRGRRLAFVCRDDGAGIDADAVRAAAVRRGLVAAADAAALGADEIARLILVSGVTTAGALDEVSGRGIGLDVVRDTVARLKGEIEVRSEPGRGTEIELRLPVSLAAVRALEVEAGGALALLPLDAVRGTLRIEAADLARIGDGPAIVHGGSAIPFVPLVQALDAAASPAPRRAWSAVIAAGPSGLAALGVDRLLGTREVVVRPLPAFAPAAGVVGGAAMDAEGNPELFLDAAGLVAAAQRRRAAPATAPLPRAPILIVDDSLTTRMLEQSILEAAGWDVELATSGEEGLERARAAPHSLFLVDVEMPGMDGFELVARLRDDVTLRGTPAILVTSRADPEDRRRGEKAGARGYVVKGEFDQKRLLGMIRELVGEA